MDVYATSCGGEEDGAVSVNTLGFEKSGGGIDRIGYISLDEPEEFPFFSNS